MGRHDGPFFWSFFWEEFLQEFLSNINVQVRVFQTSIQIVDLEDSQSTEIDFNNAFISAGFGFYQGTEIDVRRSFELTHKQKPIFLQNFVGNDSSIVDISENTISIPENFFVTGEEVEYSYNIIYCFILSGTHIL